MSSSAWPSWPSVSYYSTSNAATPSFVHTTTTAHTRPCIHSATSTASIIINTTISSVVVLIRDVFASSQISPPIPDPKHPSTNHNQGPSPHTLDRSCHAMPHRSRVWFNAHIHRSPPSIDTRSTAIDMRSIAAPLRRGYDFKRCDRVVVGSALSRTMMLTTTTTTMMTARPTATHARHATAARAAAVRPTTARPVRDDDVMGTFVTLGER